MADATNCNASAASDWSVRSWIMLRAYHTGIERCHPARRGPALTVVNQLVLIWRGCPASNAGYRAEHVFYSLLVARQRHAADPDGVLVARIAGTASRHASSGAPLSQEEEAEAVAELRELAAGRSDLLAQWAGIQLGYTRTSDVDVDRCRLIADLCIKAGADLSLIDEWITVGRIRREQAATRPYTGVTHNRRGNSE